MAQLKDTIIQGDLRVTDQIYADSIKMENIKARTSSSATTYGVGSNGQVLKSNGTITYWGSETDSVSYATTASQLRPVANTSIAIQTGSTKQSHISFSTLLTWLTTTKGYIPSGGDHYKYIKTTWAYADNDILQISINGVNYEIQLAGCILEFWGQASNTGVFRFRIHTAPTNSFTAATGYIKIPTSSIVEYFHNGPGYNPVWKIYSDQNFPFEYKRCLKFTGASGKYLKIGAFPVYDSNIVIDITMTSGSVYHGTLVIATQNVSGSSAGGHDIRVYNDPSGIIASKLRVVWTSGYQRYNIYFQIVNYAKIMLNIRAFALPDVPFDLCISQSGTIPDSTSGLQPINVGYSAGTGLSLNGTTFNHSNSIIAGSVGTTTATSGTSIYIPFIQYDAQGHITSASGRTHTIDLSGYTNQNAFSNVKVGSTTIAADTTTDTLELVGSGRVTLTPDTTNDKVTIDVPSTIPAQQVTWLDANTDNIGTSMIHTANAFGAIVINPILRANRFSGLKAAGITIEYSRDSGATWTTYSASEVEKRYLFTQSSTQSPAFRIGNDADGGSKGQSAGVCRLRIIIDTLAGGVYTNLKAFHLNISTDSSNGAQVTITAALASDPTNYSLTICSNRVLSGWSGWNLIPCNFTTYGNTPASQYQKIKFEFFDNGNTSSTYKGLNILKILGYGGMGWTIPSVSAKHDTICFKKFIAGQNEARAYFYNGVQTNTFYGGNAEITNNLSTTSLDATEADIDGELTANSINAGNLVVTGDATFSNDLRGNLIGTVNGKSCSLIMAMDITDTKQVNILFT